MFYFHYRCFVRLTAVKGLCVHVETIQLQLLVSRKRVKSLYRHIGYMHLHMFQKVVDLSIQYRLNYPKMPKNSNWFLEDVSFD